MRAHIVACTPHEGMAAFRQMITKNVPLNVDTYAVLLNLHLALNDIEVMGSGRDGWC